MTLPERFWAKATIDSEGCWLWRGATDKGYGVFWTGSRMAPAHRLSWEEANGPIPEGLVMDHLCRVPLCVRPGHLEPVSITENVQRGRNYWRERSHCANGHELGPPPPGGGRRVCRECSRLRARKWARSHRENNRAAHNAYMRAWKRRKRESLNSEKEDG